MKKRLGRRILAAVLALLAVTCTTPINAVARTAGDVDGNGKINLSDTALLMKSIAKYEGTEVSVTIGDLTDDGKVNLSDVSLLMKHIAGWDGLDPLPEAGAVLDLTGVEAVDPDSLGHDDAYNNSSNSEWLQSYYEEPVESFFGACRFYEDEGYELYGYNVMNGNHFATFVKGKKLAHVYWIECESELNVATSRYSGEALPPKTPAVTTGEYKTSVTQLQSTLHNGMGYVIQLADGSFIIYDGGHADKADQMWETLVSLKGNDQDIVIRAWLITHSHIDHYECFSEFSKKYADKVTLEHLLISPVNKDDTDYNLYLHTDVHTDLEKFAGAKLLYVHTGMVLPFCNVKMEILFAPEELYISDPRYGTDLATLIDFNSSSLISRVYTDDYSAIFLGDATNLEAYRMILYYGDYLKSDMCQAGHHGFESFPLIGYQKIKASIMWYPTNQACYDYPAGGGATEREAIRKSKYTKEIIVHEHARETRCFGE